MHIYTDSQKRDIATHAYIYTDGRPYIHTYIQPDSQADIYTYINTDWHTHPYIHA